jgi:hypothetical protein
MPMHPAVWRGQERRHGHPPRALWVCMQLCNVMYRYPHLAAHILPDRQHPTSYIYLPHCLCLSLPLLAFHHTLPATRQGVLSLIVSTLSSQGRAGLYASENMTMEAPHLAARVLPDREHPVLSGVEQPQVVGLSPGHHGRLDLIPPEVGQAPGCISAFKSLISAPRTDAYATI